MTFQLVEPILLIGLGGVGARLAEKAKKSLNSDCLLISHDQKDLTTENSIKISTKSVVNPSTHLIRGSTLETSDEIKKNIANYSTVILMSNLAGKAGAGVGFGAGQALPARSGPAPNLWAMGRGRRRAGPDIPPFAEYPTQNSVIPTRHDPGSVQGCAERPQNWANEDLNSLPGQTHQSIQQEIAVIALHGIKDINPIAHLSKHHCFSPDHLAFTDG